LDEAVSSSGDPPRAQTQTGPNGVPLTACVPDGQTRTGIVVLHEIWGATSSIGDVTSQLCQAGYAAVAPHLYHRQIDQAVTDGNVRKARSMLRALRAGEIECDVRAAIDYLTHTGAEKIGVLGFSMGATIALWAAATIPVTATVCFYGGGIRRSRWPGIAPGIELAAAVSTPWIGFYADKDTGIPIAQVEQLRTALVAAPAPTQVVRYPDAAHGFALDPAARNYAPAEAQDAWRRTWAFLAAHLPQ